MRCMYSENNRVLSISRRLKLTVQWCSVMEYLVR